VGDSVDAEKTLVTACVVPHPGATVSEADLREYAEEHLAAYKRPHQYRVVETLPRTPNGKLQRRALLERLRATT
jgi:acyl-CoA synthetase (AMP-forming)/AMP-acid ligase II